MWHVVLWGSVFEVCVSRTFFACRCTKNIAAEQVFEPQQLSFVFVRIALRRVIPSRELLTILIKNSLALVPMLIPGIKPCLSACHVVSLAYTCTRSPLFPREAPRTSHITNTKATSQNLPYYSDQLRPTCPHVDTWHQTTLECLSHNFSPLHKVCHAEMSVWCFYMSSPDGLRLTPAPLFICWHVASNHAWALVTSFRLPAQGPSPCCKRSSQSLTCYSTVRGKTEVEISL